MYKKIILTISILFALTISAISTETIKENSDLTDIEWIEKATEITVKDYDLPAIIVGLIKNGKVIKIIRKGVLNRKNAQRVDENTMFQIGSLTKTFTGIITNNLINAGQLDVNAPITKYLPKSLSAKTKEKLGAIKVKDILHHRSGIPNDSRVYYRFGNDPMICCYKEKDLLADLEIMELDFKPGEKSSYSNMGFAVLGYILENASGMTYENLIQTHISKKYNLANTTTLPSETQKGLIATPYRKENRRYETKPFEMGKMVSGGGMYSTLTDLSKLMIKQIESYKKESNNRDSDPLFLTKHTKSFNKNLSYGYGLFTSSEGMYGHGGDLDGFGSGYTFYPKENLGVVILTSSGGRIWLPRFEAIIRAKFRGRSVEMPKVRKAISVPVGKLGKYTGKFLIAGSQIINVVQNGDKIEAYPQNSFGPIELYFESETKLFSRTFDAYFEYEFDGNKRVKKVSYTFRGQKLPAKKIK